MTAVQSTWPPRAAPLARLAASRILGRFTEVNHEKPAREPWYRWLGPRADAATRILVEVIRNDRNK